MGKVTGGWKRVHGEELHDLSSSPDIIQVIKSRRIRWLGLVAHGRQRRGAYIDFMGKPEGKRPLGRPGCRWEDRTKIDLKEIGWEGMDWMDRA
jgi:hypothetical protein